MFKKYDFVTGTYARSPFWGYIKDFYNHDTSALVKVTYGSGRKNKSIGVCVSDLKYWNSVILSAEDLYSMIDLALDTNDNSWFYELIQAIEGEEIT